MSVLISRLKTEHAGLAKILQGVQKFDQESQKQLLLARDALLAHLKLEDEKLYPVLRKAAETDADLATKLELFAKEMESISKTAMAFFDKYKSGGSGVEYTKDLAGLTQALSMRIRREETILYEEYERLETV